MPFQLKSEVLLNSIPIDFSIREYSRCMLEHLSELQNQKHFLFQSYKDNFTESQKYQWLCSRSALFDVYRGENFFYSLSHTEHYAIAACLNLTHPKCLGVGVDLEIKGRELSQDLIEKYFNDFEKNAFADDMLQALVVKEACYKAIPDNLEFGLKAISCQNFDQNKMCGSASVEKSYIELHFKLVKQGNFCFCLALAQENHI